VPRDRLHRWPSRVPRPSSPSDPRSVAIGRFPSAIWCLSSTFERDALSVVGGSPHTVGIAGIARAKDALEFVETVLEPIDSCDGPVSPLLDGLVHGFDGADESVECVDSSLEIADPSLVCVDPFGESREILGEGRSVVDGSQFEVAVDDRAFDGRQPPFDAFDIAHGERCRPFPFKTLIRIGFGSVA